MKCNVARCVGAVALTFACAGALAGSPWFDGTRPGPQAREAVELLAAAAGHGLEPQDYAALQLAQAVARAAQGAPLAPDAIDRIDRALTRAMRQYLSDLHRGRIDPRHVGIDFALPARDTFDVDAVLQSALAAGRLRDAAREAAPRLAQYDELRVALARHRELGEHAAWRQALPPLPRGSPGKGSALEPEQDYAGVALLAQRLAALGDLGTGDPVPPRYEGALVDAVKAFQQRHGLDADGVIGKATLAQLQVAPAARARQIELALERLRWTPLMEGARMVLINIPEFVLRAYAVRDGRIAVEETMKVVVGKALNTRTPLFDEAMRFIEFSPYWNVPPSIARGEIVPKLRRDPGYWAREGFEFVDAGGRVDTALDAQGLDAVLAGRARIRQRPGPRNALGDIKFVFPNRANVYLHHTPATQLFERSRRDFSHGCIRVEHPVALAKFVLRGMPEWTEERILAAMAKGESATLRLAEPLPVLIAYGTALVKGGRIHFFEDIYGQDLALDLALRQRVVDRPTID